MNDEYYMSLALEQAREAERLGEVPVGAVLVTDGNVIAAGHNRVILDNDPSAHAETVVTKNAGKILQNYRLVNTCLYVTLEPCPMCAGLLVHARISRLVFGAKDLKTGACGSVMNLVKHPDLNHQIDMVGGVLEQECGEILSSFFKRRREEKKAIKAERLEN